VVSGRALASLRVVGRASAWFVDSARLFRMAGGAGAAARVPSCRGTARASREPLRPGSVRVWRAPVRCRRIPRTDL